MTTVDTAALNALLTEVTSAARAAADAAKRAQTGSGGSIDWSKLLTKPPTFDHRNQEEEIKHFKDWSWQVVQSICQP